MGSLLRDRAPPDLLLPSGEGAGQGGDTGFLTSKGDTSLNELSFVYLVLAKRRGPPSLSRGGVGNHTVLELGG